jgi:hypothetical protein
VSDENKIRDAADAVKGIVEAVPVYQDVLQPAARELGVALQTVAKTVHIVLTPVSALVWGYDKIKEWLQVALTEKLKDVPPEEIVPPRVAIAGPAIEALRFAADEPILRELYANLLATSMSSKRQGKAHPAFVDIIKQLEANDVHILNAIYQGYKQWIRSQESPEASPVSPTEYPIYSHDILETFEFESSVYESSIDNLLRVRCIVSYIEEKEIDIDRNRGGLLGSRTLLSAGSRRSFWGGERHQVTFDHRYEAVSLTSLGVNFIEACTNQTPDDAPKE